MELQVGLSRSIRPDVFCKKGVLKNFITFTGKYKCQSLFFNKVTGLSHRCFCWFCKYFKNTFFTEHLRATVSLMWSLHNSFLFILIFLKAPLFVLSFFLAILLMSFVIVLPILMILLCSLNNIEIQFATTIRVGFWTWIWPTRHCDNMVIYADDTTLYSICHRTSNLWQQMHLASELQFDQWKTMEWSIVHLDCAL